MQVIQRGILTQTEHDFGAIIGTITAIETVNSALETTPAMVWHPGIAVVVGLHGPAFAVNQAEPGAVLHLQATFNIGTVAVFMFILTL
ncbi:Uncharacterised protein [Shigella sonnei]|nr:Uncharacterised protein [Shigella sonnei]